LYGLDNFLTYLVWGANKSSVNGDIHTAAHATHTIKRYYGFWASLTNKRQRGRVNYAAFG
jgi:hypothetical protein